VGRCDASYCILGRRKSDTKHGQGKEKETKENMAARNATDYISRTPMSELSTIRCDSTECR